MQINELIVDGVKWIYTAGEVCVGIVKAHREGFTPRYFIGTGAGEDEADDIKNFLEWGQMYDRLDRITEF